MHNSIEKVSFTYVWDITFKIFSYSILHESCVDSIYNKGASKKSTFSNSYLSDIFL